MCWLSQCLKQKRIYLSVSRHRRLGFDPWMGKVPWRRRWQPTPVFLPGESHGRRSLAGCTVHGVAETRTCLSLTIPPQFIHHTARVCNGFFIVYRVVPPSPQCTLRTFPSSPKEVPVLACGQSSPHPIAQLRLIYSPASLDLPVLDFKWTRIITYIVVFLCSLKTVNSVMFVFGG